MDALKLYLHAVRINLRARFQYPRSFFMQSFAQLTMIAGEMLAVVLIIDRFGALGRWTAGDIMFFFGVMQLCFYTHEMFGRGIANFSPLVQSGRLDVFFIRPRGILTQTLCAELDKPPRLHYCGRRRDDHRPFKPRH